MLLKQVYEYLNELSPFELQESWDNSGLLVGSLEDNVEQIYVSLDIDMPLLESIQPRSLIIAHHPLIFKGLKRVDFSKYPSKLLKVMIQKEITLIAMHTNFDTTHLNKYVAKDILGFSNIQCDGYICYIDVDMSFDALSEHIKDKFNMDNLRCVQACDRVKKVALTTGSGGDLIPYVDADCYLSGDFKYHQALEAKENGLSLMDIGHYESECHFSACMAENLKNFPLKVIMSNSKNPFKYK